MTTEDATLIECGLETRLRAWNPGEGAGGYVRAEDIVRLMLTAKRDLQQVNWVGDGTYPLIVEHWAITADMLRMIIVYNLETGVYKVLLPSVITRVYRATWLKNDGDYAENIGDITVPVSGGSLVISNSLTDLPNLNYSGRNFRAVIL